MNIILKFKKNKKGEGKHDSVIAFYNKKVHLLAKDSKKIPKPKEYWECFLWAEFDNFNLVKPFQKIDPENLIEEKKRVKKFNENLKKLKDLKEEHDKYFIKVTFDENNRPYLLSKVPKMTLRRKFDDWVVLEKEDSIIARPVLDEKDKKDLLESKKRKK